MSQLVCAVEWGTRVDRLTGAGVDSPKLFAARWLGAEGARARWRATRAGRYPQARRFSCLHWPQTLRAGLFDLAVALETEARTDCGQGRGRTGDPPLFRRMLVPTELPGRARDGRRSPYRTASILQKSDWSTKNPASGSDAGHFKVATPTGLEPATSAVTGRRANQLRHGASWQFARRSRRNCNAPQVGETKRVDGQRRRESDGSMRGFVGAESNHRVR